MARVLFYTLVGCATLVIARAAVAARVPVAGVLALVGLWLCVAYVVTRQKERM